MFAPDGVVIFPSKNTNGFDLYPIQPPSRNHASLHRHHHARVGVPGQQRIFAAAGLRVLDAGPARDEITVAEHARQIARDGAVDVLHDGEIGGEEDIKVALHDLRRECQCWVGMRGSGWRTGEAGVDGDEFGGVEFGGF